METREVVCSSCQGSGWVDQPTCRCCGRGGGKTRCLACDGTGRRTIVHLRREEAWANVEAFVLSSARDPARPTLGWRQADGAWHVVHHMEWLMSQYMRLDPDGYFGMWGKTLCGQVAQHVSPHEDLQRPHCAACEEALARHDQGRPKP